VGAGGSRIENSGHVDNEKKPEKQNRGISRERSTEDLLKKKMRGRECLSDGEKGNKGTRVPGVKGDPSQGGAANKPQKKVFYETRFQPANWGQVGELSAGRVHKAHPEVSFGPKPGVN